MDFDQGLALLLRTVHEQITHEHYKRVTDKANLYLALVTGEGLDKYLHQFTRRETDEMFEQRVLLTQHITPAICQNILDIFGKVPRARYTRRIGYLEKSDENSKRKAEVEQVLKSFWGNRDADDWFEERYIELNAVDPNGFVVIEFEETDGKDFAYPYPYIVKSCDAVDYRYENMVLQYLTARHAMKVLDDDKEVGRYRYTMYLPDQTLVLDPLPLTGTPEKAEKELFVLDGKTAVWLNKQPYQIITPAPHNLKYVPAFRIGYKRDLGTDAETYVAPYEAAMPYLLKTLKINSEFDLSMTLSAHPYPLRYGKACDHCDGGMLPDNRTCLHCHGTGWESITSSQEELVLKMPRDTEDMIDLTKMMTFIRPPIDVIQFQDEVIDQISRKAIRTVFNSDVFDKQEIADTATGKNIALQNVYDKLYSLATSYAADWAFTVTAVADIIDRGEGFVALMKFPRDFKLKDVRELFEDYKMAKDSGSGPEILRIISGQIAAAVTVDDPAELARFSTWERVNPFTGYSEEFVLFNLTSPLIPDRIKTLYMSMGIIFDEIEKTQGAKFYDMKPDQQDQLILAELNKIMAEAAGDQLTKVPVLNVGQ